MTLFFAKTIPLSYIDSYCCKENLIRAIIIINIPFCCFITNVDMYGQI